jgi:hypothetical protein
MNRSDFFKKLIKLLLLGLLTFIAIVGGLKAVSGTGCGSCPGNGICKGESDCSEFLSENHGREKK